MAGMRCCMVPSSQQYEWAAVMTSYHLMLCLAVRGCLCSWQQKNQLDMLMWPLLLAWHCRWVPYTPCMALFCRRNWC